MKLPNSVCSSQDLNALVQEIHEYGKWFMHNEIKGQVKVTTASPPPALSPGALELVREVGTKKLLTSKLIDELIVALESFKKVAPTLTITLAAPATNDVKRALVDSVRLHIAPNALVTFKFNSTICGGMVIVYGSHVFDWSFRRQIIAGRAAFPKELMRV